MTVKNLKELFKLVEFKPNKEQLKAITDINGPQLIIAGPGSGKTQVLVLRCLNLLLFHKVPSSKILICTYTEKAAASLKDRIRRAIRDAGAEDMVDLSELWIGTIHSICQDLINENIDETRLTKGYEVLDELTQKLFLNENFYQILHQPQPLANYKWPAIDKAVKYFTKITEDMVDVKLMEKSKDPKLASIARRYQRYENELRERYAIDFAHMQSTVLELLNHARVGPQLKEKFEYIMVDEYQDTNYIQQQLFLKLSEKTNNICVVGDEDQSLYRFRGATVQNFLQFPKNFKNITTITLEKNYRSTPQIIQFINDFISELKWSDESGKQRYRFEKTIKPTRSPHPNGMHSVYSVPNNSPLVISKLIKNIEKNKVVEDLNQVAILLHSVAGDGPAYFTAFKEAGIKYYAPRARAYFELEEVKAILGALLYVTDFVEQKGASWNPELEKYYRDCLAVLGKVKTKELKSCLDGIKKELSELKDSLKKGIVDLLYEIIGNPPMLSWIDDPAKARNLAILSDLLTKYQQYYRLPVIRADNMDRLRAMLFNSFFYAIRNAGLDEYEDPYNIFPSGHIQIMTIHQAKGLEFPVVIVGSFDKRPRTETYIDRELEPYSKRKPYEPHDLVSIFDHFRLFYVAFARTMDLLVLVCDDKPNKWLEGAFGRAPELTRKDVGKIVSLKFKMKEFLPPKREFGIAGHIHTYDVCPKQYKHYQEYNFTGARSAGQTFGTLVHHTIEDIHLHYLKHKEERLDEKRIKAYFERNVRAVTRGGVHPLAQKFLEMAWKQVLNYYTHNKYLFDKLVRAEEPILVERRDYVMSGIVDLIRDDKNELELLDFKAQEQKDLDERRLNFYKFQLAIYTKMIEAKLKERPKRTYVYLTAENDPKRALLEIPIQDVDVNEAEREFDERAHKILNGEFTVFHKPPRDVCRNCDFRHGCHDRKRFYPNLAA